MQSRIINIRYFVDRLENILGSTWLKENLKIIKNAHGGKVSFGCGIDRTLVETAVAHIAYLWYRAREEITVADINEQRYPGPYSLAAAIIGRDLDTILQHACFEQLLLELTNTSTSAKAISRLCILAGYAKNRIPFNYNDSVLLLGGSKSKLKGVFLTPESTFSLPSTKVASEYNLVYLDIGNNICYPDLQQSEFNAVVQNIKMSIDLQRLMLIVYQVNLQHGHSQPLMMMKGLIYGKSGPSEHIYMPIGNIYPE